MATAAGRIVCSRCGANNFATQAACWKCSAPLSGAPASAPPASAPPLSTPRSVAPAPSSVPPPLSYPSNVSVPPDPSIAVWAAVALALLFPYIAVPVGIVFLMLDDRRKLEIGRITLIWGIIATILHTIITGMLIGATVQQSLSMIQGVARARAGLSGTEDNRLSIPGMSTMPNGRSLPNLPSVPDSPNIPFPEVPTGANAPK